MEAHLPTCPQCRTAVAEMRSVVAVLPYSVKSVAPPPHLKQQLFERIRTESRTVPAATAPTPATRNTDAGRRGFWSLFSGRSALLASGLASLLLLLGLGAINLQQRERIAELESRLAETENEARVARMEQGNMEARLFTVPNSRHAYIVIEGLPEPPEGQDWQVWLSPDAEKLQPVSAGVFEDDSGKWVLEADRPVTSYQWIGVTLEPDGGSPAPTSEPVMGGDFQ